MKIVIVYSIVIIVYGMLGFFGIGWIPQEYKGNETERRLKREIGIGWIVLAVPWLILAVVNINYSLGKLVFIILQLVISVPGILYMAWIEKKCSEQE